jgi:hypothetical protein
LVARAREQPIVGHHRTRFKGKMKNGRTISKTLTVALALPSKGARLDLDRAGSCYTDAASWQPGEATIMSAQDLFHNAVKHGLEKDGWTITADPLIVRFGGLNLYVDLGAEKLIAAEKDQQQIAVEVKSFIGPSALADFHTALGQFLNYRLALDEDQPQRILYLAVPVSAYSAFFTLPLAQAAIQRHSLRLIVYDPEAEALIRWIN